MNQLQAVAMNEGQPRFDEEKNLAKTSVVRDCALVKHPSARRGVDHTMVRVRKVQNKNN
jgi:hypothetical protein